MADRIEEDEPDADDGDAAATDYDNDGDGAVRCRGCGMMVPVGQARCMRCNTPVRQV